MAWIVLSDVDGTLLDSEHNILHIARSINSIDEITRGKNDNAIRDIYLLAIARQILEQQKTLLASYDIDSSYVFPTPDGNTPDAHSIYKRWRTYREQHGIHSTLHELRHTMISLLKSDMPIELLKPIVDHSQSMDTFAVYGHEVDGDLVRAADIIDTVYTRIFTK